jgi:K(+)-stimulated pyrophosphate-energized sodium pump
MTSILAAAGEAQVQDIRLGGTEWLILLVVLGSALLAIALAFFLTKMILAEDQGTQKMQEIAKAIQEGAQAYLNRQIKTISVMVLILFGLVFASAISDGFSAAIGRAGAFVVGCFLSGLTGYLGMSLAVRGNVRTAAAAHARGLPDALRIAFRTGGIAGLFTVGLGLLGATLIFIIYQGSATLILVGFGFGGSLLALFMRVGGGIYTKAADVGADLVGKVEKGIPEDDPRNAAVIADNVGDNVGDCAGMAADLFESYEVTLVASMILGYAAIESIMPGKGTLGVVFPLAARAIGVLASIVGIFFVRARPGETRATTRPIQYGFLVSAVLTAIATYLLAHFYVGDLRLAHAVLVGLVLAVAVSLITDHFTSTRRAPVMEIAESTQTGPATTILSGFSVGLEASVWAIVSIAVAIFFAFRLAGGNVQLAFYLVSLCGMGMLATTGVIVSMDTYGPVADNAAGIAEMSGQSDEEAERVMVSLDAVGNTTKAITKGFAIGSAVVAAVSLFASYIEVIGTRRGIGVAEALKTIQINIADPKTFIGMLLGGSIAFLFSGLAIKAVGRTASRVVQEVRKQFREHPGIMDGTEKPDYAAVVDICTRDSLRELATPALVAVLSPLLVGFALGELAMGAFLGATILTGQLLAVMLATSGAAWDNAKKYIEDGHFGGKGSESHKAAVIGDTVGDPFKDTAGPAINPLIKVINLVAVLALPAVISTASNRPLRAVLVVVCAAILAAAISFSKRKAAPLIETPTPGDSSEKDLAVAQDVAS